MLIVAVACGGGSSNSGGTTQGTAPTISTFSPTSGATGATVTVSGSGFTGATAAAVNGTAASFTVNSATQITLTVPNSATSGKISVTNSKGTARSALDFTVSLPGPALTSFAPTSGAVGTSVTISGTNLTGATALSFNGTAATITSNTDTQIVTSVPSGATTGKISVVTSAGSAQSPTNFSVTASAPTITSFSPTSGQPGVAVTLTGTNFTGATTVSLNGTAATFTITNATHIATSVPSGAASGPFSVTTPGGTATSATNFTVTTGSGSLDLTIDGLYVTQATQDYPSAAIPLVKNRSAWVRVFVKANQSNSVTPAVDVQFATGSTTHILNISAPSGSVPTAIDPDVDESWDAAVPAAWILPNTQVTATADPTSAIPESDKTNNQFTSNLDVHTLTQWKVTFIPVHTGDGRTGTVPGTGHTLADWVDFGKRLHPVPDTVDVALGSTMNSSASSLTSGGGGWGTVLSELGAKRTADHVTDRYYYGVVKVSYNSGVAGLGYIGAPAAIGWDYFSSAPSVLAHEVGHNFGRPHSPCGGAGSPDPNYPYPGGIIGVPGWDVFASSNNLKEESSYTDIMGYCSNQWISDYVYQSELDFRENQGFDVAQAATVGGPAQGLLVWGRIENGNVILEPAFQVSVKGDSVQPGAYTWEARDAMGDAVATVSFDAAEIADLPDTSLRLFSFIVPLSDDAMGRIQSLHVMKGGQELARAAQNRQATGAMSDVRMQAMSNRRLQLTWNAATHPVLMLRDAKSGEVRGFVRGGSALIEDVPQTLDIQGSDGIRGQTVRFVRPAK